MQRFLRLGTTGFGRSGLSGLSRFLLAAAVLTAAPPLEARIANGVATDDWPEVLQVISSSGVCSGVFVGCRTVLTAAHCVCHDGGTGASCGPGESLEDPAAVLVFSAHAGPFGVDRIRMPENYEFAVSSDLALLDLRNPVRGLRPVPINRQASPRIGTPATIVGFGRTSLAPGSSGIQRVGEVMTENCSNLGLSNATHLCWTFDTPPGPPGTNSNTCFGDSGGPLYTDFGGGAVVSGVHSGGADGDCADSSAAFDADVFVDRNWIEQEVGVDLEREQCGDGAQLGDPETLSQNWTGQVSASVLHTMVVPEWGKLLRVGLNGESGNPPNNIDLHLGFAEPPGETTSQCSSQSTLNREFCELADPEPGLWYFEVEVRSGGGDAYQLSATLLPESPAPPALVPGALLVSTFPAFEILQVGQEGNRALQSSALRGSGAELVWPEGLALDRSGRLIVANAFGGNLLRVDPVSGDRRVLSGCRDLSCSERIGEGPDFLAPRFVAVSSKGEIFVADRLDSGIYAVLRVDPLSGDRDLISGCTDADCNEQVGEGPEIGRLFGIEIEEGGDLLVADARAVLRIDPQSGERQVLSGCSDAGCSEVVGEGPDFGEPVDLVLIGSRGLFVSYQREGFRFGAVRHVDSLSGRRTTVSGCSDEACAGQVGEGPSFVSPLGVADGGDGTLLVADPELDAVFRIDLDSGDRGIVSGCGDEFCGSEVGEGLGFAEPVDVVVVPEPSVLGVRVLALGALAVLAEGRQRRRRLSAAPR